MGVLRKTQSTAGLLANNPFNIRAVICLQSCRPRCHASGHSICPQFGGQLLQRL
ncbi:hypothetical protein BDR03DRAFT_946224 [Suillus americanus]|nr:hypothetical protein BDR03DRAFT_946224 [Suillus americanus]